MNYLFHTIGPKLFFLAAAALWTGFLVKGVRAGSLIVVYGYRVSREDEPSGFWIVAAVNVFIILCCIMGAITV